MMEHFLRVLDNLSWDDWQDSHNTVECLLSIMWKDRTRLLNSLADYVHGLGIPRITKTAELHSWELHRGCEYDLKLNQFLPYEMTGRSSEGIHHHTRPLTTLTLSGGYDQDYFTVPKCPDDYKVGDRFTGLKSESGPTTQPGYIYTIDPDVFHALTNFKDDALTLAVYGKIVRHTITVFNTVTGLVEKRTTCSHASCKMVDALRRLAEN